ncbi:ribonuclease H-like domain-containing protein [Artemisia annua]|uniref:Ribonuclease H-like domain-containing protein n=1 Tax=Artemisia annua TaxID=35608 RepID=A0A2U1LQ46_ARTAN|nr:ribonuclease H-like domain-containing protein [Artemisia annua]
MWPEYVLTVVYLINRLPSSVFYGASPYRIVYGKDPDLSHVRAFGCLCYANILNNSDKFSSSSEKCVLLGFSTEKKAYKLYSLDKKTILFSRDVRFYETIFPFKMQSCDGSQSPNDEEGDPPSVEGNRRAASDDCEVTVEDEAVTIATQMGENGVTSEGINLQNQNGEGPSNTEEEPQTEFRRSTRHKSQPIRFNDYIVSSSSRYGLEKNVCFATTLNKSVEPKSYQEASLNPKWNEAMDAEMEALHRNNTYEVTDLPPGRKAIGSKWIWKIKYKSSGEVDRYKARLVAQGFGQKEGVDFEETFSHVVKMVTVRCLINLAVTNDWPLYQLDVNNAFLYGDLHEEVYMKLPPGYYDKDETNVCRLLKSLYGLKQAPRQWNEKLTTVLVDHGFIQSKNDYSLYVKHDKGVFMALLVYVDDMVITGNNKLEIEKFKQFLNSKFMIKDLGVLKYFLGIEVLENDNGVCLTQRKYCLELLSEYGLLACKPAATPLQQNVVLNHVESNGDKFITNLTEYQKLVGKLIYLSVTRPDIAYAVHCLSQHMHAPLQSHFNVGLRVLRYLKQGPGTGIQFNKGKKFSLHAFSDADWAKCLKTRKSVSGYCVYFCNNLVSWKSKKQATISRSSSEAEYRCLASATCEIIWINKILKDLDIEGLLPVNLFCHSSSAIQIAANPVFHEKLNILKLIFIWFSKHEGLK